MGHLSDGLMRRMLDEPYAVSDSEKRHYETCTRCQSTMSEIEANARQAAAMLSMPSASVDVQAGLSRMQTRIAEVPVATRASWGRRTTAALRHRARAAWRPVGVLVASGALLGTALLTPAGSLAQDFVTIFQPSQVVALPITSDELRNLPDLQHYGTVVAPKHLNNQTVADAGAASSLAGMPVLAPASLPADIPSTVQYDVIPSTSGVFTFDAAKAQAYAAQQDISLPIMPAHLNGSSLQVTLGSTVVATYGDHTSDMPSLIVGQMRAPIVASTGVSVQEVEDYVLKLPGISPELASSIRALSNPSSTLAIPIPIDLASSHQVTVQGVQGIAVGDSTGLGSAVFWQAGGIMYGVGGMLPESEVLNIANSLQ